MRKNAPGDPSQFIGQRNCENVAVQPLFGRFNPGRAVEPVALTAEARPLMRNRLFSSFQVHNSSLHCLSYADTLHERQRAWRGN